MNKLEQLIKKIEGMDQLADCIYKNEDGCMCAVGVLMDDYGILNKIAYDPYWNTTSILELAEEGLPMAEMAKHYGLGLVELDRLQSLNDGSLNGQRKERVLNYLKGVLIEHEQTGSTN